MAKKKTVQEKRQKAVLTKKTSVSVPAKEYAATLADLKRQVREAQLKAETSVNKIQGKRL